MWVARVAHRPLLSHDRLWARDVQEFGLEEAQRSDHALVSHLQQNVKSIIRLYRRMFEVIRDYNPLGGYKVEYSTLLNVDISAYYATPGVTFNFR